MKLSTKFIKKIINYKYFFVSSNLMRSSVRRLRSKGYLTDVTFFILISLEIKLSRVTNIFFFLIMSFNKIFISLFHLKRNFLMKFESYEYFYPSNKFNVILDRSKTLKRIFRVTFFALIPSKMKFCSG